VGSRLEFNDTLQLTTAQGFPAAWLDLAAHQRAPIALSAVADHVFPFRDKEAARYLHLDPVRVYLAHNIEGKWLFWGQALVQSLVIEKRLAADGSWQPGDWTTAGTFRIVKLYAPDYQRAFTRQESPTGKSFFD
jgi:hypothetical protein